MKDIPTRMKGILPGMESIPGRMKDILTGMKGILAGMESIPGRMESIPGGMKDIPAGRENIPSGKATAYPRVIHVELKAKKEASNRMYRMSRMFFDDGSLILNILSILFDMAGSYVERMNFLCALRLPVRDLPIP
ncbi:MAG: hypothetical protein ACOYYU_02950 [Chloroflexota bacterium]